MRILPLLLLAACVDEPALTESTDDITRSPQTAAFPGVFEVVSDINANLAAQCTGSMLSTHWIVLAAHCLDGVVDGARIRAFDGGNEFFDGPGHPIQHPDFSAYPPLTLDSGDDIGLIRLDDPGLTGIGQQAGIWDGPLSESSVVNVIGFGLGSDPGDSEYCSDGAADTKRIQDYGLNDVSANDISLDYGDARICPGDSGGPWFPTFEDRLLVAGVTSGSTPFNDATACRLAPKVAWMQSRTHGGVLPNQLGWARFVTPTAAYWEAFEGGQKARFISAGSKHACAVLYDGRVRCWGDNASGQLGTDDLIDAPLPRTALANGTMWKLSAGAAHTCAVTTDQRAFCWGSNASGQLGNPTLGTGVYTTGQPVQLANGTPLTGVRDISAGTSHTCALMYDGHVYCWGSNTYGQLGNDDTASSAAPVLVGTRDQIVTKGFAAPLPFTPLANADQLDAGHRHTCIANTSHEMYCWGYNAWGQLGNNTTTTSRKPVRAGSLTNIYRISAGYGHTCATYGTGGDHAACWGMNALGQLGLGDQTNRLVPTGVSVGLGVIEVSAGKYHTCFTGSDRQKCTGDNGRGALGAPLQQMYMSLVESTIEHDTATPAAGDGFTCTLLDTGALTCAGAGTDGQLASGVTTDSLVFKTARDVHHLPGAVP